MDYEFLVIFSLAPILACGHAYEKGQLLPLHCTLMPWFWIDKGRRVDLSNELMHLTAGDGEPRQITLVAKEFALFGPHSDVPVHVLERNEEINLLHTKLLVFLAARGAKFASLNWIGAGYRPHISLENKSQKAQGTIYSASHLVLVQRGKDKCKTVVYEYQFGELPF